MNIILKLQNNTLFIILHLLVCISKYTRQSQSLSKRFNNILVSVSWGNRLMLSFLIQHLF